MDANLWIEKRVAKVHQEMEKLGIRSVQLQLEWISAAGGFCFSSKMDEMEKL